MLNNSNLHLGQQFYLDMRIGSHRVIDWGKVGSWESNRNVE